MIDNRKKNTERAMRALEAEIQAVELRIRMLRAQAEVLRKRNT